MYRYRTTSSTICTILLASALLSGCAGSRPRPDTGTEMASMVSQLQDRAFVANWLILGPFPGPEITDKIADQGEDAALPTDFLAALGGEAAAVLQDGVAVEYTDASGAIRSATARPIAADKKGLVDLENAFDGKEPKVVYAYATLDCPKAQKVTLFFGAKGPVKLWLNGELLHGSSHWYMASPKRLTVELVKGPNRILVKEAQRWKQMGFAVEVLRAPVYAAYQAKEKRKREFREFLDCRVVPKGGSWCYPLSPDGFPELEWSNPLLVEKLAGNFPLQARWFDPEGNEVLKPAGPGGHRFVAEGVTPSGMRIRRGGTVYILPGNRRTRFQTTKAYLDYVSVGGSVDKAAWDEHRDAIAGYAGRMVMESIRRTEEGAILMSYLDEMEASGRKPPKTDSPIIRDQDHHLAIRRKILGLENKWPELKLPRKTAGAPARVLRAGTPQEAGVKPDTADKLRKICNAWFESYKEPFVMLVARHGVIVIHEAFGEAPEGPVTTETPMPTASVTKLVTAMMFGQFLDQGLIDLDDPVGKFLPDIPVEGPEAITLRQCFTHTTGLYGHKEWRGMDNPWLESVVANALKELEPGTEHEYNGMGYDLAGKVMEAVSGKSIFRLMRENLFDPIGAKNTFLDKDLGYGCNSTAMELGMLAQTLLNKGSYGDLTLFSPETFESMLPRPLSEFWPGIDKEWGIGLVPLPHAHPDAGEDGVPKDKTILSPNIFGHGSATATVFNIDPDNDLVITQTRRRGDREFVTNLQKCLMAIEEGLVE